LMHECVAAWIQKKQRLRELSASTSALRAEDQPAVEFAVTWLNPQMRMQDKLSYLLNSSDQAAAWGRLEEWDPKSPMLVLRHISDKASVKAVPVETVVSGLVLLATDPATEPFQEHMHAALKATWCVVVMCENHEPDPGQGPHPDHQVCAV